MKLLGKGLIDEFKRKHANSRSALDRFVTQVEGCNAKTFVEFKKAFPAADQVGADTVFDVGGNKVRVISVVTFVGQQVLVTEILTHAEYDKGKWK